MESLMMETEKVYEMSVLEFNFVWLVNEEAFIVFNHRESLESYIK